MAFYGEEAMMLDTALPAVVSSPSDEAYFMSLHAHYPGRPFRLWDLPRELRDLIYDYALVEAANFKLTSRVPKPSEDSAERDAVPSLEDALDNALQGSNTSSPGIQATVKYRPSTNILLTSKELKREYEERAQQAMRVVLTDHDKFAFQPFRVPEQATKIRNFELHLILFCHSCNAMSHTDDKHCHAALELHQHMLWLEKLLPELGSLRSLQVHAYISHDRYRSDNKLKIPCERVVLSKFQEMRQLAQAKNLYLYKYDYNSYPDLNGPKAAVWEWSARDGVVKTAESVAPPAPVKAEKGDPMDIDEDETTSSG